MIYSTTILLGATVILVIGYLWRLVIKKKCNLPGPVGFPLFGIYPFLQHSFFKDLRDMGKKYGDIYHCQIGITDVVVVNSFDVLDDLLRKNADHFNDRGFDIPESIDLKMGFAELDLTDKWRELRSTAVTIINNQNLGERPFQEMISDEIASFMKYVNNKYGDKPFNPKTSLLHCMGNILLSLMFNNRLKYEDPEMKKLVSNVHEVLVSMDPFGNSMMEQLKVYFGFQSKEKLYRGHIAQEKIEEKCDTEIKKHDMMDDSVAKDFIDMYFSEVVQKKSKGKASFLSTNTLSGTSSNLFVGGLDSTGNYLIWLVLLITKYPEVQRMLHDEIDRIIERNRTPTLKDRDSMPCMKAVLQETHRFASVFPLGTFHKVTSNKQYKDYFIPNGFYVLFNYWAVHHDERVFENPMEFKPQRFLNAKGEFVRNRKLIPFSTGPRGCPGEVLVQRESFLFLANVLQNYSLVPPKDVSVESISVEPIYEASGLIAPDYEVSFVSRNNDKRNRHIS